jgi:hypothetical protein
MHYGTRKPSSYEPLIFNLASTGGMEKGFGTGVGGAFETWTI